MQDWLEKVNVTYQSRGMSGERPWLVLHCRPGLSDRFMAVFASVLVCLVLICFLVLRSTVIVTLVGFSYCVIISASYTYAASSVPA